MTEFNADAELNKIKLNSKIIRRKSRRYCNKTRIDKYKAQLCELWRLGAKQAELVRWLRRNGVKIHHEQLSRILKFWGVKQ